MKAIIELINDTPFTMLITIILMLVTILVMRIFLSKVLIEEEPQKKDKGKKRILDLFHKQLGSDTTFSLEYLRHIKSVVERESSFTYNTSNLLEDYIVYISELDESSKPTDLDQIFKKVESFIETETQEQPFEVLPDEERRLFHALTEAIERPNDEAIQFNLRELSSVISLRHKSYKRALAQNRWSVPLAVIGLILTLVFGFSGIFSRLNSSDIDQSINNAVKMHLTKEIQETGTNISVSRQSPGGDSQKNTPQ